MDEGARRDLNRGWSGHDAYRRSTSHYSSGQNMRGQQSRMLPTPQNESSPSDSWRLPRVPESYMQPHEPYNPRKHEESQFSGAPAHTKDPRNVPFGGYATDSEHQNNRQIQPPSSQHSDNDLTLVQPAYPKYVRYVSETPPSRIYPSQFIQKSHSAPLRPSASNFAHGHEVVYVPISPDQPNPYSREISQNQGTLKPERGELHLCDGFIERMNSTGSNGGYKTQTELSTNKVICSLKEGDLVLFEESIGAGAFASVHLAQYKGQQCAAKMLLHHAKSMMIGGTSYFQQEARNSIMKECSFLEKFRHENVIQHITTAVEPKCCLPILVMELMDFSLKKFIQSNSSLDLKQQLTICHGVASGLHYLHSHDIIHRDLCDDNVLLKQVSFLIVKISDFGMSTILDYESMSATMTAVGHRKGYLPPEGQGFDSSSSESDDDDGESKVHYSHHLDVYSLGAVATQTVQSANQFKTRKDLKRAFKKIANKHPLKGIIAKCIEKESKKRPQAKTVSDFVTTVLEEEGYEISPPEQVFYHGWPQEFHTGPAVERMRGVDQDTPPHLNPTVNMYGREDHTRRETFDRHPYNSHPHPPRTDTKGWIETSASSNQHEPPPQTFYNNLPKPPVMQDAPLQRSGGVASGNRYPQTLKKMDDGGFVYYDEDRNESDEEDEPAVDSSGKIKPYIRFTSYFPSDLSWDDIKVNPVMRPLIRTSS